jgi:hypothetical protein
LEIENGIEDRYWDWDRDRGKVLGLASRSRVDIGIGIEIEYWVRDQVKIKDRNEGLKSRSMIWIGIAK